MSIHDDLKAYIDGELSPERTDEVRDAISTDSSLREAETQMRNLGSGIRQMAHELPILGAEKALQSVRRKPFSFAKLGFAASLLLFSAFAVTRFVGRPMNESSEFAVATLDRAKMETMNEAPAPMSQAPALDSGSESSVDGFAGGGGGKARAKAEFANEGQSDKAKSLAYKNPTVYPEGEAKASRQVIQTADMTLLVVDANKSQSEAQTLAKRLGGFVSQSSASGAEEGTPTAMIVMRVPEKHFETALASLRKLGEKVNESVDGQDVTAEVADTTARLKVMRAEEDSYVTMLRGARKVGELLEIKERLSGVRQEIESITARQKTLVDQSSLSTISATFQQRPRAGESQAKTSWSEDAWANAINSFRSVGQTLGTAGINVIVFSPVWLPLLFGGLLIWKRRV